MPPPNNRDRNGDPTLILTRDEVVRILRACDRIEELAETVYCPDTGLVKEVTVLKEREAARVKTEDDTRDGRRNWMIAIFGAAGSAFILSAWAAIKSHGP